MELNITRDNGEIEIFNAYRVQHDNSRGPFKGGFRFHQNVSMDDVRRWGAARPHAMPGSLALCMHALHRLKIVCMHAARFTIKASLRLGLIWQHARMQLPSCRGS